MKHQIKFSFIVLCFLAACSGTKEQLGISKKAPDEFAVVKHAPLAMPPDFSLTPPRPGAPRPQEQTTDQDAAQTVFGIDTPAAPVAVDSQSGESAILARAGASNADPAIRRKIDAEQVKIAKENVPVAKKIFNFGKSDPNDAPVRVVDPKAEVERLKNNKQLGKPVTAGKTPTVER
jgi:hypothetical protein